MSKSCKDCLHYEAHKHFFKSDDYEKDFDDYFKDKNIEHKCPEFTNRYEWVYLPCNIGKTFFRPISWKNTIDECTVSSLTQKADKTWKIRLTSSVFRSVFEITANEIGKTVFLTREEAEQALKEIEKND